MNKHLCAVLSLLLGLSTVFSQSLTEVSLPQYMQGTNGTNNNRLTYICRLTLDGLTANATYRYYTSAVIASDNATSNGAGTPIFLPTSGNFYSGSSNLSTSGQYGEFTTNSSGSFTGWFGLQPTGNSRFTSGNTVNIRIMLNNGAGGTSVATRLTTTSGVTVLNLGTTTALATGINSVSCGDAKNLVLLWDNTTASGRPISGAAIEDDGFTVPTSYATFYRNDVDGTSKAWGTLIPNTLANGIRRIEQFSLSTGSAIGTAATDADGLWPTNAVNTVNPSSGTTALVIDNADAPLATCSSSPELTIVPTTSPLSGFCAISPQHGEMGSIQISGAYLTGASVTLNASTDFELSLDGITFGTSVNPTYTAPTLAATNVYVRLKAGLSVGAKSEVLTLSGGGATSTTLTVEGTVGAAATLGVGDIMFTGFKTTTPGTDQISFFATVDIPAGTDILFTDKAWDKTLYAPNFNTSEQTLTWNSGASLITKGTVVKGSFSSGTSTWNIGSSTGNALDGLSSGGDNVFAYQLSSGCPAFLHGVSSIAWLSSGAVSTNNSYLPEVLNTANGNILSGGTGNQEYTGTRSCNTIANYKTFVSNNANWGAVGGSDVDATAFVEGLSISLATSHTSKMENDNSPVTITATACTAVPATVTVTLSYSGSATAGTDFTVLPATITIPSGSTTGSTTLTNINDMVYEGNDTAIISIASVSGGGAIIGSPASVTYTIVDDDDAVYYSCASGSSNAAIWSPSPACPTSGTAVFSSSNRFVIQSGHTIELASSPVTLKSLEIQSGGKLWRNSSVISNTRYLSVFDYIDNQGTLGNSTPSFDAIGINIEGTNVTLSGGGDWNIGRLRKTDNTNTVSNLTIADATIRLYYPGTAFYNNQNSTTLNVHIVAGATLYVSDTITIDGPNGLSTGDRGGTITVDGNLIVDESFLARSLNPSGYATGLTINAGGKATVKRFRFNNNVAGGVNQFQVTVNGILEIKESLDLEDGTFNGNDHVVFLSPSASQAAIIDNFSTGYYGTYSGTGTFQRGFSASSIFNQLYFSAPINNAAITSFAPAKGADGVAVTPKNDCDETQLATSSNYGNVFEYNENLVNNCYLEAWVVRSAGNAQNGKGYSVVKSGSGKLELSGTPNMNASYTINNLGNKGWALPTKQNLAPNATIAGWHLLGNPFPANLNPVNPNASEFGNIFKVLDAANGQYVDFSFSGADLLAPFQGFFVYKANNGGTANFDIHGGSNRTRSAIQFYKNNDPLKQLKIKVSGNGNTDECYLNIIPGATAEFDLEYDGYKWFSDASLPALFTSNNSDFFSTNTIGSIDENPIVPLHFKVPATETYQLEISGIENLNGVSKVIVEDQMQHRSYEFTQNGDFLFNAIKGDAANRFQIRFEAVVSGLQTPEQQLKLFVNSKVLHVDLGANNTNSTIDIFNTLGAKVAQFGTTASYSKFDISNLGIGTFIAKVKSGNTAATKKFTIAE